MFETINFSLSVISIILAGIAFYLQIKSNEQVLEIEKRVLEIDRELNKLDEIASRLETVSKELKETEWKLMEWIVATG